MQLFFPKREKKEQFLVLDIGTETIKTLIFEKKGEKNILLAASLEYFDNYELFDSKNFETDIIKRIITKTTQDLKVKRLPRNALFGLSANILKGKIFFQSFQRKNSKELINKKEAGAILKEVLTQTQKTVSQFVAEEIGILPKDLRFLSFKILEIKIDGYQVPALEGYSGQNLVFRVLAIFLPEDYFKNIESIAGAFNLKKFKILHLIENLPRASPTESENGLFLDIGGQTTEIFLIKDGHLEKIEEMGIGGKTFSQGLSQALGIREKEGRELKERYSKELLSIGVKNRISEILDSSQKNWYENLKSKIKEMNPKGLLPSTIFLFGGGSLLPEIQEILKEGNWQDIRFMGEEPVIKFIYPKNCYPPLSIEKRENLAPILNNPQYTSSFLIYYARKNF